MLLAVGCWEQSVKEVFNLSKPPLNRLLIADS